MEHKNGKTQNKTSSTELSADFDVIVNEINDFIAILEERGQQYQEETTPAEEVPFSGQCSEHSDQEDLVANHTSTESESSSPFASPRNTVICVDFNPSHLPEEPLYEEFEDVKENDYEPLRPKVTAVATADLRPTAKNFEIRPRPDPSKMGDPLTNPKRVKALHNFKGKNNDELCFGKGDIITITQAIEGGWWEGTLNGKTGWFPSNYVKELKTDIPGSLPRSKGTENQQFKRESMQYYHNMVLNNVIETEKTHVQELVQVLQNTIQPIQNSGILTPKESTQLIGNLEDIVAFQNHLLSSLEECLKFPPHQRRVGGIFMKNAPRLKELYLQYCANHPRAAVIIQNKREELSKFLESLGTSNGALALTTNLYKPFTRLDKYPSLLKELERHIDESHIDRGDTQRAIAIYKDISNACMEVRKHKEMEYEILTSAIKGWEGEEMVKLGEVIHLSHVQVSTLDGDKLDRIFVLFPNILVMLSMSPRLSGYQYEGSLPLSGMTATACEEEGEEVEPKSFSISGNMIEKMVVTCTSKWEMTAWVDALTQQISVTHNSGTTKQQSFEISTSQASISTMTKAMTAKVTHSTWSSSCLRPSPPLRQHPMCKEEIIRSPRAGRKQVRRKPVRTHSQDEYDYKCKWRQYDPRTMEEDALILKVIEAYCTSAKTRHTVNSFISLKNPENKEKLVRATIPKESVNVVKPLQTDIVPPVGLLQPDGSVQGINSIFTKEGRLKALFQSPHVLIAEEEKIIVDDGSDPSNLQEKTLVDTVYSLKDQVKNLENEHKKLKRDLDDERMCRLRLENAIRKALKNRHDIPWDENLT